MTNVLLHMHPLPRNEAGSALEVGKVGNKGHRIGLLCWSV